MRTQGLTSKGPPQGPNIQQYLRIAVIALSVVSLVCAAVSLGIAPWPFGAPGFVIFVAVKTFIIYGAIWFVELQVIHMYYRLGVMIAYCFNIIFWLSAWSWSASWATAYCLYYSGCADNGAMAACAAFGAFTWVVSIAHLFFYIRSCLRDVPEQVPGPYNGAAGFHNNAELGQVKQDIPPQQPYVAQQYPQQTHSSQ
ncbi:hypothetical protein MKZ38_002063 [Zalerion maritima]|uniref:MARVEL domain-containing protein n=1 Tax=Zalerion maritima TaxID=339359 RepID=A0AAD5WXD8_9PEZI|nr:hypothetical protein MKZ38_002063 [Zalerion maritima]